MYSASAVPDQDPRTPVYGIPQTKNATRTALPSVWGEAAPGAGGGQTAQVEGVWRDGALLVIHKNALLPDRCLKCNAPTGGQSITRTFRAVDATMGWLRYIPYVRYVYWIARATSDKKADINLSVCPTHHSHATAMAAVAQIIRWGGLALMAYGLVSGSLLWILGLFTAVFGAGLASCSILKLRRMDDYHLWLSGAHPNYLASLPPV
ncbi:MAG TPA: hypothetical protein VI756_26875 [Blastocatellia bacterium]